MEEVGQAHPTAVLSGRTVPKGKACTYKSIMDGIKIEPTEKKTVNVFSLSC